MSHGALGWLFGALVMLLTAPAFAADTVYYYSSDALHSEVVVTDQSRNVVERTYYAPYGQVLNRDLRDGPGYTGHEEDPETNLVYMQQRYYDPEAGRFLSVDPVAADGGGGSFNRYEYASDNPYRYTDPDGRYTCEKSVCAAVGRYVAALRQSYQSLRAHPGNSSQASRVRKVIGAIGLKGEKGPHYVAGHLKGDSPANSDQRGTTTIDVSKNSSSQMGAAAIGHEAQHDIDAKANGVAGDTSDRATAKQQFNKAETNAYKTTNAVLIGFGFQVNPTDMQNAIDSSVTQDLKIWNGNHSAPPSSSN